jgi:hypothetical protein
MLTFNRVVSVLMVVLGATIFILANISSRIQS